MSLINLQISKTSEFQAILQRHLGAEYVFIDGLDAEKLRELECSKPSTRDIGINSDRCKQQVIKNTDFFMQTWAGYLGVLHYSANQDVIVHLSHANEFVIVGDTLSNWAPEVASIDQEDSVMDFMEECSSQFGIQSYEFDEDDLDLIFDPRFWTPLKS